MWKTLGVILIVAGLVIAVWGAFGFETKKKVLDLGPIEATKTTKHEVPYAPVLGAIVLVGGIALVATAKK